MARPESTDVYYRAVSHVAYHGLSSRKLWSLITRAEYRSSPLGPVDWFILWWWHNLGWQLFSFPVSDGLTMVAIPM